MHASTSRNGLAIGLLSLTAVAGPLPDAFEPDDGTDIAQAGLTSSCERSFHQDLDEDWLAFYYQRPTEITVTPSPEIDLTDDGVGTGIVIELYSRTVDHQASFISMPLAQGDAGMVIFDLPILDPGFYFLRVGQCRNAGACFGQFPPGGAGYCLDFLFDFGIPNPGLLQGVVRDGQSAVPLSLVLVETTGNAGTLSNLDGSYSLSDGAGTYTATVRAPGYLDTSFDFTLLPLGTTVVDVDLFTEVILADGFEDP